MDVYSIVTERIVARLEAGEIPWRKPWVSSQNPPANLIAYLQNKRTYQGINVWLTAAAGYSSPFWLTYKQAKDLGGNVKAGEKAGSIIVFFKSHEIEEIDENTGLAKHIPVLRYYSVFNIAQCEGIDEYLPSEHLTNPLVLFNPIESCEKIVANYRMNGPEIEHGMTRAAYSPSRDKVILPQREAFYSPEEYYTTLFHELGHSTGHETRLNRDMTGMFGDHSYSKEELIAEFTAAYLANLTGIEHKTEENSAAYIQHWIKVLRDNKKYLVSAAAAAQKAANYIQGINAQEQQIAA